MSASKGRYWEGLAIEALEAEGLEVMRAAASKGTWDLIAWDATRLRFVQVKGGRSPSVSARQRAVIEAAHVPPGAVKEVWRYRTRRGLTIETIGATRTRSQCRGSSGSL